MARRAPSTLIPSAIRIGYRHRQDLGDLSGLAASIATHGLLHPIVVRPDGLLVAGARRLAAWRLAVGFERPIPVHVVDIEAVVAGQYDENVFRKDLTPSELVGLMRELTPAIAAVSRLRQAELGRRHGTPPSESRDSEGGLDPAPWRPGRTRDQVARLLGVSAAKLHRAAQVVDAAAAEPERFGGLVSAMDRTGRVNGPFRRLVVMRQAEQIRAEPPPLPSRGPYRVFVADPPWPYDPESEDPAERGTHPYPQMSYRAIAAFGAEVRSIAHDDAALWLWTTNHHLPHAFEILAAWDFAPKTMLTWGKDLIGRGQYLRERTEHAILAVRGRPAIQLSAESTLLMAPRMGHSEKPAAFYGLVERVCPAPRYACLFSHMQAARPGWDQHTTAGPRVAEDAAEAVMEGAA